MNAGRPDYVGFVFAESKRKVTKEQAKKLRSMLYPQMTPVGVFVNEKIEMITELVQENIIDVVQLHGEETEEYIKKLRWCLKDTPIVKAIRVSSREDVKNCEESQADYLLFDSRSLKAYGGTGETFDWELIKEIQKPFFLAGGINKENIEEAILKLHPFVIDVSSAVETDGLKDRKKIIEIVEKVRQMEE